MEELEANGQGLSFDDSVENFQTEVDRAVFRRGYHYLKEQHVLLTNLVVQIETTKPNDELEKKGLGYLVYIIKMFLTCDFGTIFTAAKSSKDDICKILDSEHSEIVEKFATTILKIVLALIRIESFFKFNTMKVQERETDKIETEEQAPKEDPKNKLINNTDDLSSTLVLCRICEQFVPLSLIEQHSKTCAQVYETEYKMVSTDEKLRRVKEAIKSSLLNIPWPGDEYTATTICIPLLHIVMLVDKIVKIDPKNTSAKRQLQHMLNALDNNYVNPENINALSLVARIEELVKEKIHLCTHFSRASIELSKTTLVEHSPSFATSVADFEFVRRISSGAYARVFVAKKIKTGDIYAIKVTPKSSLKQKNQVKRIIAEKQILLNFINPFIVNFFYSIIGKHNLYLVMEFLPGGDLYSLLQKVGSLDEDSSRIYAAQIIAALNYLHSSGIIHRDLKPDNILVSSTGHLKLTDFGLSYLGILDRGVIGPYGQSSESIVQSDSLVGTPDYLAPEVVMSQPHSFTADYWSLGVIIYEFLVGVPPFHSDDNEVFANILKGSYSYPEGTEDDYSPEVRDLISKLLILDPKTRLGAKGIKEIQEHPWFKGIDWKNVDALEPPFVPDIKDQTSTSYFEDRYKFKDNEEDDILDDIRDAKAKLIDSPSFGQLPPPEANPHIADAVDNDDSQIIREFPSISLKQLEMSNEKIANTIRHRRAVSFFQEIGAGQSPLDELANMPQTARPTITIPDQGISEQSSTPKIPRSVSFDSLKD